MRAIWFAMLCACGRVSFDPIAAAQLDAAADTSDAATAACMQFGPWSTPQTIAGLNSAKTDWGPQMSHDGLELVFASTRAGNDLLFAATRATVADAWSAPAQPAAIDPFNVVDDPALSANRQVVYFGSGVHMATRASPTAGYLDQGTLAIATAGFSIDGGPQLSVDGSTMLFTGTEQADGLWHEYEAKRAPTQDPFVPFGAAAPVPLAHTVAGEAYGSYRGDMLEIIYETEAAPQRLFSATRATLADSFGTPTQLELGDPAFSYGDPGLSDDGLTLWFASTRTGGLGDYDLWYVTRDCI